MVRTRRRQPIQASVVLLLAGGCASSSLSPLNFGVRHVPGADPRVVFEAARGVLMHEGYGMARADAAAGVIITKPVPMTPRREQIRIGVQLSSKNAYRRFVHVRITQSPPPEPDLSAVVSLYCMVAVQEQATEAHRMFQQGLQESDAPVDTPIDRPEPTTTEEGNVWQTVYRDKGAERRILEAVLKRIGASSD